MTISSYYETRKNPKNNIQGQHAMPTTPARFMGDFHAGV